MTPLQRKRIEMLAKFVGPIATDQLAAVPGNMAALGPQHPQPGGCSAVCATRNCPTS